MGILYIVPTPVGNMEDMTLRAIRILREADVVLAEDTRTSGVLLKHFDIQQHLLSHHKFNEHGTSASIVERLKAGQTVALISDAGTPGISDPGFFWFVKLLGPALRCRRCLVLQLLFLLWCRVDCLATVFVSRDFFPRKKDARRSCSRWWMKTAR